jgi:2-polyprenyl-6-methoxyphenol hydroxylase-like FAD-dependent oxidoreductase
VIDVLIVGGGPVGLATAIEARLAGLTAVVLEPRHGPIDKACGEGLMPGALPLLARLGVDPAGMPLAGISYRDGRRCADHRFSSGPGRGVRRTTLHAALAARAAALGVETLVVRVGEFEQGPDSVAADGMRARWLIGADGLHSSVRRRVGLERSARAPRRFGLRRHFALAPWSDRIEVHWGRSAEAYVTPVAPDLVSVCVLGPARTDFDSAIAGMPALAERLAGVDAGPLAGAGALRQATTSVRAGRVLLVGDASGYVDAITGEGLRLGFEHAHAAIASIAGGPGYEAEWRRITRGFRVLTSTLVTAASGPARRAIVPTAVALPWLYGAAVERLAR